MNESFKIYVEDIARKNFKYCNGNRYGVLIPLCLAIRTSKSHKVVGQAWIENVVRMLQLLVYNGVCLTVCYAEIDASTWSLFWWKSTACVRTVSLYNLSMNIIGVITITTTTITLLLLSTATTTSLSCNNKIL